MPRQNAECVVSALDEVGYIQIVGVDFAVLRVGRRTESQTVAVDEDTAAAGGGDKYGCISADTVA